MIGKRILNNELKENGRYPVFSANVFSPFGRIDKTSMSDFEAPSVLWGIDGDWMVNYVPENYEFTPTDHCGVLRINSKDFNAHYVAFVIRKLGKELGFSRSFRASIDRLESLSIPKIPVDLQNDVMKKIEGLQENIKNEQAKLLELEDKMRSIVIENI